MTENYKLRSPLSLAFLGDAVYEIYVRERLVKEHNISAGKLSKLATHYVNAASQSLVYNHYKSILTQEELDIMRRGRNANAVNAPRRHNPTEYRRATGVETLYGYLHLTGAHERLHELFLIATEVIDNIND